MSFASRVDWQSIEFTDEEIQEFKESFNIFDQDGNGHITTEELANVFKDLGESVPGYQIRDMIAEVDLNNSKTVEFDEFVDMMKRVRASGSSKNATMYRVVKSATKLTKLGGQSDISTSGTAHSFSEEETVAFADWINYALGEDSSLKSKLPIDTQNPDKLFSSVKDGILICKLINTAVPDTIDERVINMSKLNAFTIGENQTLAVNSAAAIGCNVVNIGATDLSRGTPHLVLGLLWQIIRIGLFANINIQANSAISALLTDDEEISDAMAMSPEDLLLRWVNYHLAKAGTTRRMTNFTTDVKDSEIYTYLLAQIAPADLGIDTSPLSQPDAEKRAEMVLDNADKMGCRKFVRPHDIVTGNPKLNMAFVANLFNMYPALDANESKFADFELGDMDETREERTFRNWMNSLGVNPFVYNVYSDLDDGIILLQLIDKVQPGIVDWEKKVNNPPFKKHGANMKKIENLNYAISLCKELNLSVVGIAGSDIFAKNKTLTLAVIWQLMRAYTIRILQQLSQSDAPISDAQIVEFVNDKLAEKGRQTITGFKDPYISTSRPIIDLIEIIKPGSVKESLLNDGATDEDKLQNAKYAVSTARKIGAGVYALPEDVVEVKPKMVMTVFACLMARALGKK